MERTNSGAMRRLVVGLGFAAIGAALTAAVLTCLFAAVLAFGAPDALITLFAYLIAVFSAFTAGFLAGRKMREGGLKIGLLSGAAVFLLHLLCTVCFGAVTASCLIFLPVELLCGAVGGIVAVNLRR